MLLVLTFFKYFTFSQTILFIMNTSKFIEILVFLWCLYRFGVKMFLLFLLYLAYFCKRFLRTLLVLFPLKLISS